MKLYFPHIIRRSPELLARAKRECKTQKQVDRMAKRHAKKKGLPEPASFADTELRSAYSNNVRESLHGQDQVFDRRKTARARDRNRARE